MCFYECLWLHNMKENLDEIVLSSLHFFCYIVRIKVQPSPVSQPLDILESWNLHQWKSSTSGAKVVDLTGQNSF